MKLSKFQPIVEGFMRSVTERYAKADLAHAHVGDATLSETVTIFWINGDRSKCVAAIRTDRTKQDNFRILERFILDAPQDVETLPRFVGAAFLRVEMDETPLAIPFNPRR